MLGRVTLLMKKDIIYTFKQINDHTQQYKTKAALLNIVNSKNGVIDNCKWYIAKCNAAIGWNISLVFDIYWTIRITLTDYKVLTRWWFLKGLCSRYGRRYCMAPRTASINSRNIYNTPVLSVTNSHLAGWTFISCQRRFKIVLSKQKSNCYQNQLCPSKDT